MNRIISSSTCGGTSRVPLAVGSAPAPGAESASPQSTQRMPIISPMPMSAHAATVGSMSLISPSSNASRRPSMYPSTMRV